MTFEYKHGTYTRDEYFEDVRYELRTKRPDWKNIGHLTGQTYYGAIIGAWRHYDTPDECSDYIIKVEEEKAGKDKK